MKQAAIEARSKLTKELPKDGLCRILSLDGGGAKGFYTLGVLREIEGMVKCPLYQKFDLIFGTSTGAIIAALLALGKSVQEISDLYEEYVPVVMKKKEGKGNQRRLPLSATRFSETSNSMR